jgi:hypothetical protein
MILLSIVNRFVVKRRWILGTLGGGLVLRLITGLTTIKLYEAADFSRDWKIVSSFVTSGKFIFLGPTASINPNFHLGPFYYYFLTIPRLISSDYRSAIIFVSIVSSISIYFLYFASLHWFSKKYSLMIAAGYSFSLFFINIGSFPSNAYIMPAIISFLLYFLVKIREGNHKFLLLYFLFMSFLFQTHATGLFLIPVLLFLLPLNKIKPGIFLFSVFVFLLSFSPWLIYNFRCGNCEIREGLHVFEQADPNENCDFKKWMSYHGHGERCFSEIRNSLFITKFFSNTLLAKESLLLSGLMIFASVGILLISRIKSNLRRLILLWLFSPWLLFMFYSSNVYIHYFIIFFPMQFLLFTIFLQEIERRFIKGRIFVNLIFAGVIFWNLINYVISLRILRG